MKTSRTRTTTATDGSQVRELIYGRGAASALAYMLEGFLDWQCYGILRIAGPHNFGIELDGIPVCAVYGSMSALDLVADDPREGPQIESGLTAAILFRGINGSSYVRRMTPDQFDDLVIADFKQEADDLYYNS